MKLRWVIFVSLIFVNAPTFSAWNLITPSSTSASYSAALSITPHGGIYATAAMIIEYSKNLRCQPAVGIMFVKHGGRGHPVSKSLEPGGSLTIVAGNLRWQGGAYLIRYENGYEVIAPSNSAVIQAIRTSGRTQIIHNNQIGAEFPMAPNSSVITVAEQYCKAS